MSDTRTLVVASVNEVASGTSANGNDWTLYEVHATDEAGNPVDVALRSFSSLSDHIGKPVVYDIKRNDNEKYGTTFTLTPPKKKGGGNSLGPKLDELRERVTVLESKVQALALQLEAGPGAPPPPGSSGSQSVAKRQSAGGTGPPAASDDDIPF